MKRLVQRRHTLSFDISSIGGTHSWPFLTQESFYGIKVGYDFGEWEYDENVKSLGTNWLEQLVHEYFPKKVVKDEVRTLLNWLSKFQIQLNACFLAFVMESSFGRGFIASAITGKRRRLLVRREFCSLDKIANTVQGKLRNDGMKTQIDGYNL